MGSIVFPSRTPNVPAAALSIELPSFLDDDPGTGRLVVVETLGAGRLALERRGRVLAQLIAAVDEGRPR